MRILRGSIIAGLAMITCMLFVPSRSFGWGKTWPGIALEQIVNAARWKWGAIRYNAAFLLGNAGYDSDIYFGSTLNQVPDYTFTAGPDIRVFLPIAKGVVIDISEMPQYVFYLRTIKDRALNNTFQGQVHFALERVYFQVGGGLISATERLSTELNFNVKRQENNYQGLFSWQTSEQTSVAVQYRSLIYDYENTPGGNFDFRKVLGRKESYLDLTANLQQSLRTRFFLDAEYGTIAFTDAASRFKDARSYGLYAGIDFLPAASGGELARGIRGRINLGYKRFNILDPRQRDYEGLVGNSSLTVNVIPLTTLRGAFTRDIQFSVYSDLAFFTQTVYSAGLSRALTKTISVSYDIAFVKDDYALAGMEASTMPRYLTHAFGFGFRLGKDIGMDILASLGKRNLNLIEQFSYRNFIGINLTYGSPTGGITLLSSPFTRN